MQAFIEQGFHHIRVQVSTPGYSTYGNKSAKAGDKTLTNNDPRLGPIPVTKRLKDYSDGKLYAHPGGVFEPKPYIRVSPICSIYFPPPRSIRYGFLDLIFYFF